MLPLNIHRKKDWVFWNKNEQRQVFYQHFLLFCHLLQVTYTTLVSPHRTAAGSGVGHCQPLPLGAGAINPEGEKKLCCKQMIPFLKDTNKEGGVKLKGWDFILVPKRWDLPNLLRSSKSWKRQLARLESLMLYETEWWIKTLSVGWG